MNVAIIGSGGREHALAYQLCKSPKLSKLFIIPGNPGTALLGDNVDIPVNAYDEIIEFSGAHKIELVIIGPEVPLVDGLADKIREKGIAVFGPNENAAILEGSKKFSKDFMKRHSIPTADFKIFTQENFESAVSYLEETSYPVVIKASGLAAGKGVAICDDFSAAKSTLEKYFIGNLFGESGHEIVIEQFLTGEEASVFAVTDGEDYVILPSSQDHKRVNDGDEGPNTGGMGAYAPAPIVTEDILKKVEKEIILPTLSGLAEENRKYNGCLYVGLMINNGEPNVVEFNCRFGDPETQVILPILEGDFLQLLYSASSGKIDKSAVSISNKYSVCVVEASGGYPGNYKKGMEILGLDSTFEDDEIIFHAGTMLSGGKIVSTGGRVLGITAVSNTGLKHAKAKTYAMVQKVHFNNMHYRTDIADKALR